MPWIVDGTKDINVSPGTPLGLTSTWIYPTSAKTGDTVTVSFILTNIGSVDGNFAVRQAVVPPGWTPSWCSATLWDGVLAVGAGVQITFCFTMPVFNIGISINWQHLE